MGNWDIQLDRSITSDDDWRNEMYRNACHEAAHAVVAERVGARVNLIRLTDWEEMIETKTAGDIDYTISTMPAHQAATMRLTIALAGPAFESLLHQGRTYKGCGSDMDDARQVVSMMTTKNATSEEKLERFLEFASQLVVEKWPLILAIGKRLAYKGEITGRQVRNMMAKLA